MGPTTHLKEAGAGRTRNFLLGVPDSHAPLLRHPGVIPLWQQLRKTRQGNRGEAALHLGALVPTVEASTCPAPREGQCRLIPNSQGQTGERGARESRTWTKPGPSGVTCAPRRGVAPLCGPGSEPVVYSSRGQGPPLGDRWPRGPGPGPVPVTVTCGSRPARPPSAEATAPLPPPDGRARALTWEWAAALFRGLCWAARGLALASAAGRSPAVRCLGARGAHSCFVVVRAGILPASSSERKETESRLSENTAEEAFSNTSVRPPVSQAGMREDTPRDARNNVSGPGHKHPSALQLHEAPNVENGDGVRSCGSNSRSAGVI